MAKLASIVLLLTIASLLASTQDVYARKHGPAVTEVEKHGPFYVHVSFNLNNPNTTAYEVARASITGTSPTDFGFVRVDDDLITADPDPNSQELGRSQGLVTYSDLSVTAVTLNLNFHFTDGIYGDSTLCILGRSPMDYDKRELVVAGGTGDFRFAHGYAIATTISVGSDITIFRFDVYITYNDNCIPSHGV